MNLAPRAAALRPEHAGAVDRGQGQRALELRAYEVLGAVTLDDTHRAGVRGQRGRIGEHPIHDQPLVGAEPRELPLREAPLECGTRPLHLDPRRRYGAGRLAGVLGGDLDDADRRSLERRPHGCGQVVEPGDGELLCGFSDRAGAAIGPPEADRSGDVRPHDRRDAGVPHHPPLLDAIEKTDGGGRKWALPGQ